MATSTKKCKVCGKEYEYCHTARRIAGIFRWQDVACSPEHGSVYLSQIMASRSQNDTAHTISETRGYDNSSEQIGSLDEDEYDELFDEEFEDSDEELVIET